MRKSLRAPLGAVVFPCLLVGLLTATAPAEENWRLAGPGGGGRFLWPAVASDGDTFLCASDMGSAYRGTLSAPDDIAMIPAATLRHVATYGFFFHPTRPKEVYAAARLDGLRRSQDGGATWEPVRLPIEEIEWTTAWPLPYSGPWAMSFSRKSPDRGVLVFTHHELKNRHPVFLTEDGGASWRLVAHLPENAGRLVGVFHWGADDAAFVALPEGVFRLRAADAADADANAGKDGPDAMTLEPFWRPVAEGENLVVASAADRRLYLGVETKVAARVRFTDDGENWQTRPFPAGSSWRRLKTSAVNPHVAYFILNLSGAKPEPDEPRAATIYKTTDGFKSYQPVLFRNRAAEKFNIANPQWTSDAWGWQAAVTGLEVCPGNSNIVVATDMTQVYLSQDGGKSWRISAAPTADGGKTTQAGGMPLMSAYGYYIDPHDPARRHIAMNDFSNWISRDNGATWAQYNEGNPFPHNNYVMLFDENTPGRLWMGASKDHDLPHWKWQQPQHKLTHAGGLLRSDDAGRTWRRIGAETLPSGNVTGLARLPDGGALVAAVFAKGIFRSDDDGETWRESQDGIGKWNREVFRLRQAPDGALWALTSVKKPGHLFRSDDGGLSWTKRMADDAFPYPTDIVFHPADADTIFVSGFSSAPFKDGDGGVRKSVDGGQTWTTLFPAKACWSLAVDPRRPDHLVACTYFEGLFTSRDGGATWARDESFPAVSPIAVTFDPEDPAKAYVACFGASVFHGTLFP